MKQINVLAFGRVAEILGTNNLVFSGATSTGELTLQLETQYPGLKNVRYAIALDKKIIDTSTPLNDNDTVALLPPFSGG